MKKITLACVLALLYTGLLSQDYGYDLRTADAPLFIGDYVKRSMPLGKFINYKSNTACLADFEGRVVILSFWFTTCASCIVMFPKEEALQQQYNKNIQFIMVTYEPEQKVRAFIKDWEQKNNTRFQMPIIIEDILLRKTIRNFANPNYAWLSHKGKLLAQTSADFINSAGIHAVLQHLRASEENIRPKISKKNVTPIR